MAKTNRSRELQLPTAAQVSQKIFDNAAETRLLRSLHRLLIQLEDMRRILNRHTLRKPDEEARDAN